MQSSEDILELKDIGLVRWGTRPTFPKIEPASGVPGTMVTVTGNIMTTRYGSNTLTSTNGKENKILRVYINGQTCEPKDTVTDTFYGLALEPSDGVHGYIKCKMGGSYVGNQNITIIIDFEYGRSYAMLPTVLLRSDGKLAMLQTYAEVNSVSPAEGSVNGGTVLTITGNNFDNTDAPVDVKVGGETCTVTSMTDTEIQCKTPNQPAVQDSYAGGRGLFAEQWTQTSVDFADRANIAGLSSSAADYVSSDMDSSSFVNANKSGANVLRLTGYFVPSITAPYRFLIKADGYASLNFSPTGPPADQTEVARCEAAADNYWTHNGQTSPQYDLVAGNKYFMTVLAGNANALDSVKVSARSPISPVTASMSGSAYQEIQNIILISTKTDEVQVLEGCTVMEYMELNRELKRLIQDNTADPNQELFEWVSKADKQLIVLKAKLEKKNVDSMSIGSEYSDDDESPNSDESIKRLKELQYEKKRLLNDLSEQAGMRLTNNNPGIANLGDDNRPSKISERFSELYDNHWTDAMEALDGHKFQEREGIEMLLEVLNAIYEDCKLQREKRLKSFASLVLGVKLEENHDSGENVDIYQVRRLCYFLIRD
ncbi:unnamed protein product [Mytilus edulis]|uniref:PA14 domain-containing protein n=1 Tax=Mytilus edulis TaxID=6550 RepID=A0A8S3U8Q3_MYTED|nr:unnamed protein product [Mytilus edulis]